MTSQPDTQARVAELHATPPGRRPDGPDDAQGPPGGPGSGLRGGRPAGPGVRRRLADQTRAEPAGGRRLHVVPGRQPADSAPGDDETAAGQVSGRPADRHLRLVLATPTEAPLDGAARQRTSAGPAGPSRARDEQPALGLVLPFHRTRAWLPPTHRGSAANGGVQLALEPADLPINQRRTSRDDLPEPAAWSRFLVPRLLEVVDGRRPAGQLRPWADDRVLATLTVIAAGARRRAAAGPAGVVRSMPPSLRSVHVCEPADGVAEVAARFISAGRSRALALRLEGRDGRWRAVSIRLG